MICGSAEASAIVLTPPPAMLKVIASAPAAAFASMMAWRSEPAPASFVLVTVKVASVPCHDKASKVAGVSCVSMAPVANSSVQLPPPDAAPVVSVLAATSAPVRRLNSRVNSWPEADCAVLQPYSSRSPSAASASPQRATRV